MKLTRTKLEDAVRQRIVSAEQADSLFEFLKSHPGNEPRFDFTHVLYYLGGLIAIGAMTLFMNLGWESFGGTGIVAISLIYAAIGLKITYSFNNRGLVVPAGICATFVIALTPLFIYGLQLALGLWPDDSVYRDYHRYIQWHWLYMELGTLAVGISLAWKFKYPFMIMPIAVTLWYMTMDISAMISGGDVDWELRSIVSLYTGLLMIGLAFWVDIRSHAKADYAFWLYLFGVIAFWGGLSMQDSNSELGKFIYLCINLLMVGIGVLLTRRVFVVFGAIGCCAYLAHLADDVFRDSWLFPIALSAIGLVIIYLGILWQKNEQLITMKARSLLPPALRKRLENR
ncbi:DUF2157 domain-containing protein [Endozoicomonas atrinae]|uniref:DUF2157 domain-containing protein n=1 Tax=Endozoicomonas atrinae TaxID=1333660 RepID=UPI003AFFE5B0